MICQQFFNIPVFVCELISSEYDRGFHAHEWGPKWPWKWGFERYSRGHDKVQGHPDPSRDGQSKHVAPGRHAHCLCRINFRLLCLGSPLLQVRKPFLVPFPPPPDFAFSRAKTRRISTHKKGIHSSLRKRLLYIPLFSFYLSIILQKNSRFVPTTTSITSIA